MYRLHNNRGTARKFRTEKSQCLRSPSEGAHGSNQRACACLSTDMHKLFDLNHELSMTCGRSKCGWPWPQTCGWKASPPNVKGRTFGHHANVRCRLAHGAPARPCEMVSQKLSDSCRQGTLRRLHNVYQRLSHISCFSSTRRNIPQRLSHISFMSHYIPVYYTARDAPIPLSHL